MDRATFFHHLRRSNLLSDEDVSRAEECFPGDQGAVAADGLVAGGLLTRFQADQLLAGLSRGFLLGPYRILDQLGKGGMAYVFKAIHTIMERVVAIKVLRPDVQPPHQARHLFRWEARALAMLEHPNILRAYHADHHRSALYLVLEYVDGPTLKRLVRRKGPLPVGLACDLIRQAAGALQQLHERGVVHRDVKPSNLLIGGLEGWHTTPAEGSHPAGGGRLGKPVVKLFDFGLAYLRTTEPRLLQEQAALTRGTEKVCGTANFIAPEQCRDSTAVDTRADLYSLGCTFYSVLTGRVPFPAITAMERMICHATAEPEPVQSHRPDVPAPVAAIVHRLMAKDPAGRFQTPADVAEALAPWSSAPGRWAAKDTEIGWGANTPVEGMPVVGQREPLGGSSVSRSTAAGGREC
jgi:serine/threonine protein kinase